MSSFYVDKATGEKVSIISEDTNFYVLNNSVSIKKDVFARKYEQEVEIDPNSFFSTNYSTDPLLNIANQIRNIDSSKVNENQGGGASVKFVQAPVILSDTSLPPGGVVKQPQMGGEIKLSKEQKDAMLAQWRQSMPGAQGAPEPKNWDDEEERLFNELDPVAIQEAQSRPPRVKPVEQPKVDPIQMMFKMFKNNYPVKLSVLIEENIPNPTFIGMVQENVEADAVEYYANLISDKLLKDPSKLKDQIYNQLKSIINKELGIVEEEKEKEE